MAMEWRLLQEQSHLWWRDLHEVMNNETDFILQVSPPTLFLVCISIIVIIVLLFSEVEEYKYILYCLQLQGKKMEDLMKQMKVDHNE